MPFGFNGQLVKLKLDREKILEKHRTKARELLRLAAREFVLAAYVHVPVWSGMARGGFKYARGRVGPSSGIFLSVYLRVLIPIEPVPQASKHPKKTPEAGGAQSRYTFSDSNNQYRFTLNIGIDYFEYNELSQPDQRPSWAKPWNSFAAGKDAFDAYIQEHKKDIIPDFKDGVSRSIIKVTGRY